MWDLGVEGEVFAAAPHFDLLIAAPAPTCTCHKRSAKTRLRQKTPQPHTLMPPKLERPIEHRGGWGRGNRDLLDLKEARRVVLNLACHPQHL